MVQQDIRWIQRFSNYRKALAKLSQAMAIMSEQLAFNDGVDELLQEGMIQRFESDEGLCRVSGVYRHPRLP